ncbi:MAG: hypothetical protein KF784_15545 [Fimbriimonadaceae bacterium]|nr:hypothetical protein [Fimbriimonadaceae bacterium]
MSVEHEFRHEDIELIRMLGRSLSGSEETEISDESLLRLIFFSDRSELERFANELASSPTLSRRFLSLQKECDKYSAQPITQTPIKSGDEVLAYVSGAIEESTLTAIAARQMSDEGWSSPDSSMREIDALQAAAITLTGHSLRASMSDIYVSSFRGAAVASPMSGDAEASSSQIDLLDPSAEIDADGTLRFSAEFDSKYAFAPGTKLGLHLIDPCGGSLLLGTAAYSSRWSIAIEGFEQLARLETKIVPSKLFAVCVEGHTPRVEQWRSYVYDSTMSDGEASTPSSELLIWSPPRVEDGSLIFGVDFPDGMLEVHEDDSLRLNMRIGWRKQALAQWPMSAFLSDRYTFRVPFPYIDNQGIPFGSLLFFEIC